jgi:GNAT superfamily N-acetyltransferase
MADDDVTIRPMRPGDAAAAAAAAGAALRELYPEAMGAADDPAVIARQTARAAHLQQTDPDGCWVAEQDGRILGCALSLIREGVWGFSLFGLVSEAQGRGIGTRLYAPALAYGAGERGGIILSSSHSAAMRRYARSDGFVLMPAVGFSGAWDPRRVPDGLRSRPGDLEADRDTVELASRHARTASHLADLPTLLAQPGQRLLVLEGEGFVCARDGSPSLLAATSEAAAEDLLWSAFASGPRGGTVSYDFVTQANQWAVRVGLEAGLAVSPDGPVFVRGEVGPMAPYLPSGAYL